ncbi:hypothetical protein QAD02_013573 [Eretmocerus hayati]|uniref:Uncharacterized protein n=1 Tax=Eretmocerus hayati TaxID=131215 RepID=A0ACC2P4N1_9HYME|nr:hypothetical protein QAD02_013573 [Eretmocerus hayati]
MHPSIAECTFSFQKSIEELSGVVATLKNLSSDVDNLRSRVEEIGQVANQIPAIVEDVANLKNSSSSELSEIKDRLNKLERNAGSASRSACNVDALTLEIQDRNSKMKNLIMFNVPGNLEQDSTHDLAALKENLRRMKNIEPDKIKKADIIKQISIGVAVKQLIPAHLDKGYSLELLFCGPEYFNLSENQYHRCLSVILIIRR